MRRLVLRDHAHGRDARPARDEQEVLRLARDHERGAERPEEIERVAGERNRTIAVIKSRGMAHSNQAAEYRLGAQGLQILDTYLGASGVLTGSARLAKEAEDQAAMAAHEDAIALREQQRASRRKILESKITALRAELAAEDAEIERAIRQEKRLRDRAMIDRQTMARSRNAFPNGVRKRNKMP